MTRLWPKVVLLLAAAVVWPGAVPVWAQQVVTPTPGGE